MNRKKLLVFAEVIALGAALVLGGCGGEKKQTESVVPAGSVVSEVSAGSEELYTDTSSEELVSSSSEQEGQMVILRVTKTNSWAEQNQTAFQYELLFSNQSEATFGTWKVILDTGKEVKVQNSWNCSLEADGNLLTFTPADYNAKLAKGAEMADVGMILVADSEPDIEGSYVLNPNTGELAPADGRSSASDEKKENDKEEGDKKEEEKKEAAAEVAGPDTSGTPFENHGKLSVKGTDLVDESGKKYQLRGVSTHGLAWFPQYVNADAFRTLRNDWGANLVRLAMYTDEYGGYCSGGNQGELKDLIDRGVNYASDLGMYVIIDWHILYDNDPNQHKEEAKAFFDEMTKKYADRGNVLYEICNEPNGATTWADVKKYAEEVIPVIRKNAPDAVIICGTPTWSQDVDQVAADPIKDGGNLMYTLHFYAATHKEDLRKKMQTAIASGTPVFISEFSICDASGNGTLDYSSAEEWKNLIKEYNLSFAGWSLSNKDEASAIVRSGCDRLSDWTEGELSDSGNWLKKLVSGQ
uniref:Endoglucanase n=1 Tax=Eubacterium cellulosolvens (strain ATCC 43171 / JCM 9499 / 6) TaxID=633697 RepID=I5AVZ7_EUBC6